MMKIPSLQELLEAGVHFGHKVSRGNPRMKPFIYGSRDGVHIIDLTISEKFLREACDFAKELGQNGKVLLFVGTKKQAQDMVGEAAKKVDAPYLVNHWVGGFLTNFEEISKNIKRLKELKEAKTQGNLQKYTKKEQLLLDRRMADLQRVFGGVENLTTLPDVIFVADANKDAGAVREASRIGVKVIAVVDSNADPTLVDFPIPGNDDAIKSITILVSAIATSYGEGKSEAGKVAQKVEAKRKTRPSDGDKASVDKEEVLPEEVIEEVTAAEEEIEKKEVAEAERVV